MDGPLFGVEAAAGRADVRSEAKDNPSVSASSTWRFEVRMSRIERFADDFDEVVDLLV